MLDEAKTGANLALSQLRHPTPDTRQPTDMRTERDTLGEVLVPDEALYGAQTQRAVENYPVSGLREHPVFIRTFIQLKRAAALANRELGAMKPETSDAIVAACDELLAEFEKYRGQF